MENATKALLIAASVLVVIILIAISIRILSSTSGVTNQVDTVSSNLETSMFNSQFSSIAGSNVSGTQVKSLISKVIVNNAQNSQHPTNQIYHYQKEKRNILFMEEMYAQIFAFMKNLIKT